jgi:hypothetical protein
MVMLVMATRSDAKARLSGRVTRAENRLTEEILAAAS